MWFECEQPWEGVLMLHDKTKIAPTARETEDSQDEGRSTYLDEIWMHAVFLISAWGFLE